LVYKEEVIVQGSEVETKELIDLGINNTKDPKIILEPSMDTSSGQLFKLEDESLIALRKIAEKFQNSRIYREKEVNEILKGYYDDYVTLRRYLIEYGFLARKSDGSQYWLKE